MRSTVMDADVSHLVLGFSLFVNEFVIRFTNCNPIFKRRGILADPWAQTILHFEWIMDEGSLSFYGSLHKAKFKEPKQYIYSKTTDRLTFKTLIPVSVLWSCWKLGTREICTCLRLAIDMWRIFFMIERTTDSLQWITQLRPLKWDLSERST